MRNQIIESVQAEYLKKDKETSFRPGDTVKVYCKIFEGDKSRIQIFEGVVIRKKRSGLGELFTVRRVTFGIGVERTFFTHSPLIDSIKAGRKGKVRRAKLYYLRKKSTKDARIAERDTKVAEVKTEAKAS